MKIGFTNGCFDILHIGHIRMLAFAKSQCDYLIVAIDSDSRVKELKGSSRPINNQNIRTEILSAISAVDQVEIFDSAIGLENLAYKIKPDIMIVGTEYKNKTVIGSKHAKKLIFFERVGNYSTSKIIKDTCYR
jgi:D-beta-D-heptose 7-phosphate kinase/D-beta-D-heptose 1-phosphate adenosyltransferase